MTTRTAERLLWSTLMFLACAGGARAQAPTDAGVDAAAKEKEEKAKAEQAARAAKAVAEAGPGEMPTYGETMVVTASRTEETILDAPVAMTVVGAEKLELAPTSNVADVLRTVPGLNVIQTSARDFSITQRGATNTLASGQLALLDGRSIYQDFYGFVMWDVLPVSLDEIRQIEVVRGPASAVWGANAFSGVINVRSKSPREIAGGEAMIGGGEVGTFVTSARWADAPSDKWSYKVSAAYSKQDAWERPTTLPSGQPMPPGAVFENEGTKQPKFDVRVDYEPDAESLWSFNTGIAFTSGLIHTGIGPFSVDDSTYLGFGQVSYRRKGFDGTVYLNRIDGDATNVINTLPFAFEQSTIAADLTQRVAWGGVQTLLFGVTGRHNGFDLSIAPREDSRDEVGGFIEDQIRISDAVRLNIGARLDWFDTIGTTFSPRTSLIVKPDEDLSLRLSYNRAFRSPSLVNNYLETAVPNAILLPPPVNRPYVFPTAAVGNEDLDEERIDAIEAGVTWIAGERATLSASVYRNETQDVIDFYPAAYYSAADPPPGWPLPPQFVPPGTLPKLFSYRNIGQIIDKGFEFSFDYRLGRGVSATASYAFQDDPEVEDDDPATPLQVNLPPKHSYSLAINAQVDRFYATVSAQYVDRAFWSDVLDQRFWGYTDAYTMINMGAGMRFDGGRYTLALNVTDLTDKAIQQHAYGDILRRRFTVEGRLKL